ncbi:spore protease YyaC [Clostridium estertheticum]|uniref:spore protease YyaC n=1 Tax=Clostridium estertheticum TaxID=238834 RepID=UPI001CF4C3A3|nr:spore protease YyaC [Clostridium estertheticum]MCB2354813.1 spore protease YyaC [Clostridium estertheticum]WAG41056.1 spore protease YyaC [Clostridium estertheticum]
MSKAKTHYKDPLAYYTISNFLKDYIDKNTLVVCIGTDRCIGDCLGPLVGTFLKNSCFPLPVYGTIDNPIHALNIDSKLSEINAKHPNCTIIGVDACLGDIANIGEIQARNYPIHPGKGVGKNLPKVGNVSLVGIVDSSNDSELFTNRNIRLSLVMEIANVLSRSLIHSYYLYSLTTDQNNLIPINML